MYSYKFLLHYFALSNYVYYFLAATLLSSNRLGSCCSFLRRRALCHCAEYGSDRTNSTAIFCSIIRLSCTCYVCISHHQGRNDIQSYRHGTLTTSTYISCTHSFMVLFCLKSRGCKYTVQEDLCQYGSHHPTSHKTLEACQVKKTGLLFLSLLFKATV